MKRYLTVLSLVCCFTIFGQFRETVELKNGSVICGQILEQNTQQVKIQKKDGSILVLNANDVVKIDRYQRTVPAKGYYARGSFGILGGPENGGISLQLFQGYALNRHLQLGAGFGIEFLANPYVPAFLEFQYNLLNNPSTPFVKVIGGYDFPINFSQSNGGFTFGASVGYRKFLTHHLALTTSLGYRYARLVEQQGWWDDFVTIRQANRFELSVGLTFR